MKRQTREDQYLEKPLPSSHESERAILGSILIDNTLIAEAAEVLRPEDFYSPTHRRVYSAMLTLFDQKQAIDPILIGEELKREGAIESVGGVAAITNLSFGIPHFDSISDYIEIVRQKKQLRDLIRTCTSITSEALAEDTATGKILTTAQTAINQVCTRDVRSDFVTVQEQGFEIYNKTVALRNREITSTGLQTGLRSLDFLTDGFQPADLIIIGGRPSMGKSSLAGKMATGACEADPEAVVPIFSLEMSKAQYVQRLISSISEVDLRRMRRGDISQSELDRVHAATVTLGKMNLVIDDSSSINALRMHSKLLKLRHEYGRLDGVFIDFLQRMSASKRTESRQQEVSRIAQDLKSLAKDLNIPVIALSSLSRGPEARNPPKPRMSDLRESGDIESEADIVAFVYRDHYYNENSDPNLAELIIEKHRNGPVETVKLNFMREFTKFKDYD